MKTLVLSTFLRGSFLEITIGKVAVFVRYNLTPELNVFGALKKSQSDIQSMVANFERWPLAC